MFCKKCGKQIVPDSKFCPECGASLNEAPKEAECVDETQAANETEAPKAPQSKQAEGETVIPPMRDETDMGAVIKGAGQLFLGAVTLFAGINVDLIIVTVSGIGICIIGLIMMMSAKGKVYDADCPYCSKKITVQENCDALDCPICKERIIIENYTLKQK